MEEKVLFNKSIPQSYLDWFNYCDDAKLNEEEFNKTKRMLSEILSKDVKEFKCCPRLMPEPRKYSVGDVIDFGDGKLSVVYSTNEFMYICYECIV